MISDNDANKKSLHEALLYYYEIGSTGTKTVNYIVITDCSDVYLISAKDF